MMCMKFIRRLELETYHLCNNTLTNFGVSIEMLGFQYFYCAKGRLRGALDTFGLARTLGMDGCFSWLGHRMIDFSMLLFMVDASCKRDA